MSTIDTFTGLPQDTSGNKPYLQMGNQFQTPGIQDTMYQNVDFNIMSWPQNLINQGLANGTLASALPNPLTGTFIQLPDGNAAGPSLSWVHAAESGGAAASGLYRNAANDYIYEVAGAAVTEWKTTEFRVNYLTSGQIVFPDSNAKLTGSSSLFWDNTGHTLKFAETQPTNTGQYIQKISSPTNNNFNMIVSELSNTSDPRPNGHWHFGWNDSIVTGNPEVTTAGEPEMAFGLESHYQIGAARYMEAYVQYGHNNTQLLRPWFARIDKSTDYVEMFIEGNEIKMIDLAGGTTTEIGRWFSSSLLLGGTTVRRTSLRLCIEDAAAGFSLWETGAAANSRLWDFYANASTLNMRVVNDAVSVATNFLTVVRNGTALTSITVPMLTNSALTSGRISYSAAGGLMQDSANLLYDGTGVSIGSNAALTGGLRLQNATTIAYRNGGNSADLNVLKVTNGNFVLFGADAGMSLILGADATTTVGFFGSGGVARPTIGANVNNVAASGTTGQFDDFTNGAVYATDYAALHATVYQLTRSVAQLTVAVRNLGLGA